MGNWVEPHSPEGYLKRMQEQYDQAWDDWFETRSQSARERLDRAEQQLQQAKGNKAANDEAKARWQQKLQAEEDERKAQRQKEIDQKLEPVKVQRMRAWLIDHPYETEKVFNEKVWPLMKANIIEEDQKEALRQLKEQMRRSGRYSM